MLSMCSHPEFDDEMLPLSKEMRLKAQRFVREISVGEQQSNRTHSQNLATEYLPSKKASIGTVRHPHRQRTQSTSTANAIRFDGERNPHRRRSVSVTNHKQKNKK